MGGFKSFFILGASFLCTFSCTLSIAEAKYVFEGDGSSLEHFGFKRVKLLIQNQDEMMKQGRLSHPFKGIGDCFSRTIADEGFNSLWCVRGVPYLGWWGGSSAEVGGRHPAGLVCACEARGFLSAARS